MKTKVFLLLFTINQCFAQSVTVADVAVPSSLSIGDEKLVLNGAGVREKYFMDMYVGALYLSRKSSDGNKIISDDETMAITLKIVSTLITSSRMQEAVNEGFVKSTGGNISTIKENVNLFVTFFAEPIKKEDIFKLTYQTTEGVIVYKNGIRKGVIKGMDFKKALWGIWLGADPVEDDLKMAMLGK